MTCGSRLACALESPTTSTAASTSCRPTIPVLPMPGSTNGWPTCRRAWSWPCREPRKPFPITITGMLTISRGLLDQVIAHARADHPDEACGVTAGPAGSGRPERFVAMTNAERSPTFYRFDSMEQLHVWREMEERDEEPVVIYHSHTATQAYPSRTDISYAMEPTAHYLLVSTMEPRDTEVRSFLIADGLVTEEEVKVADADGGMIEA